MTIGRASTTGQLSILRTNYSLKNRMKRAVHLLLLPLLLCTVEGKSQSFRKISYQTDHLKIDRLSAGTYVHVSYLDVPGYGKVSCNGLVFVSQGEAVVFDTPTDTVASAELIRWVQDELRGTVEAVVVTHFHEDCLGGLAAFHRRGITSYANHLTVDLARQNGKILPEQKFDSLMTLEIGGQTVENCFFGAGHTADNIVGYIPSERVLFGGCLIKTLGADEGNLEDADVSAWSATVRKIKQAYPEVAHVVPGHGEVGASNLLDYTIEMFGEE